MSIIDKYDVIIIGAGNDGKNLLVVDQRPVPAGVCYSIEREGYTFDVGTIMSHLLSGLLMTIGQMINKWMS